MNWSIITEELNSYILVFCRIGGILIFNPLLSRKNVPAQIRAALTLGITLLITPTLSSPSPEITSTSFSMLLAMSKELFIGFGCGIVFQMFYYLLFTAGDVIDMGFGMSMAKAFDPGTNIQLSRSGAFFQIIFVLYIFVTNSHLLLIKIMVSSYDIVGMGAVIISDRMAEFIVTLFVSIFSLIMRLALPFLAVSFVLEISMGVLMKLIPQINVFSIHFQFIIMLGLLFLFMFSGPITSFLDTYMNQMFINIQNIFKSVAPI